jgi:hypothetical protein
MDESNVVYRGEENIGNSRTAAYEQIRISDTGAGFVDVD